MKVKTEYTTLLDSGELQVMFPQLSGTWKKDKALFTSLWEQNQEAINNINVDFEEDEQEDFG